MCTAQRAGETHSLVGSYEKGSDGWDASPASLFAMEAGRRPEDALR